MAFIVPEAALVVMLVGGCSEVELVGLPYVEAFDHARRYVRKMEGIRSEAAAMRRRAACIEQEIKDGMRSVGVARFGGSGGGSSGASSVEREAEWRDSLSRALLDIIRTLPTLEARVRPYDENVGYHARRFRPVIDGRILASVPWCDVAKRCRATVSRCKAMEFSILWKVALFCLHEYPEGAPEDMLASLKRSEIC